MYSKHPKNTYMYNIVHGSLSIQLHSQQYTYLQPLDIIFTSLQYFIIVLVSKCIIQQFFLHWGKKYTISLNSLSMFLTTVKQQMHSIHTEQLLPEQIIRTGSYQILSKNKVKGRGHPVTGHRDPRGEVGVYIYSCSTSVLGGGEWSAPRPGHFTPAKDPVPNVQEPE
jgi:hypothetical protein